MEVDDLTEEQSNALSRFREFTHIDSVETCRQYLVAHDWDVERAIETALTSDIDLPSTPMDNNPRTTTDFFPSAPPMPDPDDDLDEPIVERPANQSTNPLLQLLAIPFTYLYALFAIIQPYLPWSIIHFIVSFFQSLVGFARPVDPLKEMDDYCHHFDHQYGRDHPAFYRGRLGQAFRDAQREVKLLFIYLHDKNSPLCDRFCREVLCEDALRITVGNNLLWSASIDTQEGAQASRILRARAFPCFCIVAHHGSQQTVQLKLDHYNDAGEFLAELINGVEHADQTLQVNRERQNNRNSRDRLVDEQNAAYLESLRADEEKQQQRVREENQRRQLEEDCRRVEEEKERKLREFAEFRENIKKTFPEEPTANESDIIQVSIRLPANEPIRRRFRLTDPAKLLFEFAWTNSNVPNQFELLWGYPRQRYQYKQIGEQRIADVMKGTTETCYLEQIDEENN